MSNKVEIIYFSTIFLFLGNQSPERAIINK